MRVHRLGRAILLAGLLAAPRAWSEPPDPPPSDGVVRVSVDLHEFGTRPEHIELPAARRVRITVTNTGRLTHTLVIEGLGIATDFIQPGGIEVLEFVPRQTGRYRMTCAIDGHVRVGRAGELVVSGGDGDADRSAEVAVEGDTQLLPAPAAR